MYILVEEHHYKKAYVKDLITPMNCSYAKDGVKTLNVGYCYNSQVDDFVFVLPKSIIKDEKILGIYDPDKIINLNECEQDVNANDRRFLFELSMWIYTAIKTFRDISMTTTVSNEQSVRCSGGVNKKGIYYIDIIMQLLRFNRENKNFFLTSIKNLHSGYNRINWRSTIAHTREIIQDECPVYLNPINKKRKVNFDEELLIIFFSILKYIGRYGLKPEINFNYQLITGKRFETYLKGYGKKRLHEIKYKYFSDKSLKLWKLCYAFFELAEPLNRKSGAEEYLFVTSLHGMFEFMIDRLISDNPLPDGITKHSEDGRIMDHLYKDKSLFGDCDTYFIADSKYYSNELDDNSILKQFIYAGNVISDNVEKINNNIKPSVSLRDEITEGYNTVPNFFINADITNENRDYNDLGIREIDDDLKKYNKFQFKNRFFDRDTLFLIRYYVNLLYIIKVFARNKSDELNKCKKEIHESFRESILKRLNEFYSFSVLVPHDGVDTEEFITRHFKQLNGKVYMVKGQCYLALSKDESYNTQNSNLKELLKSSFDVKDYTIK